MDVRPATTEDIEDVARVLGLLRMKDIPVHEIETLFAQTVASPYADILLGIDNGRVVGIAILNCVLKLDRIECRADDMVVAPEARGSGIGTKMFEACDKKEKKKGCYKIEFTSRASRERAQSFYKKLGYEIRDSNIYVKFSPTVSYTKTNYKESS